MAEHDSPPEIDRRKFLKGALATAVGVATGLALPRSNEQGQAEAKELAGDVTLRALADIKGFEIGAMGLNATASEEAFNSFLIDGGPMHMNTLCAHSGNPEEYFFSSLDSKLKSAQEFTAPVEAHHFVWGYDGADSPRVPQWVKDDIQNNGGDPMPTLNRHIETVMQHVNETSPSTVRRYTVVNEPLNPWGGYEDADLGNGYGVWTNAFNNASANYYGDARKYIVDSFNTALNQDPSDTTTKFLINEYHAEQPYTDKGEGYLQLVQHLADSGLPMDRIGVGFQMHLVPLKQFYQNGHTFENSQQIAEFAANFREHALRFPAQPYITEMSVDPSGWLEAGYSREDMTQLMGETYAAITKALTEAGGKSLMVFDSTNIMSRFKDEPNSVYNQLKNTLTELPDAPVGK